MRNAQNKWYFISCQPTFLLGKQTYLPRIANRCDCSQKKIAIHVPLVDQIRHLSDATGQFVDKWWPGTGQFIFRFPDICSNQDQFSELPFYQRTSLSGCTFRKIRFEFLPHLASYLRDAIHDDLLLGDFLFIAAAQRNRVWLRRIMVWRQRIYLHETLFAFVLIASSFIICNSVVVAAQ